MRVLVDTNVLLRTADVDHQQHATCRRSLELLAGAAAEICIVPQVLYEFWVVATRPIDVNGFGMSHTQAAQSLQLLMHTYSFYGNDAGVFDLWRALVTNHAVLGKSAHDVRLVASMLSHGITHILTLNSRDFSRFKQIDVRVPDDVLAGRMPQ